MNKVQILDGGMGRELKRIGAPFQQPEWSALALLEARNTFRKRIMRLLPVVPISLPPTAMRWCRFILANYALPSVGMNWQHWPPKLRVNVRIMLASGLRCRRFFVASVGLLPPGSVSAGSGTAYLSGVDCGTRNLC